MTADKKMDITELRKKLKELYMICFPEDSESYADFFINEKFDGTNCMTLFDGDVLVNMLFLVKKKMVMRGVVFDVPYMVAGGTLPEYRGRGIFNGVILQNFKNLKAAGRLFTGLMPFDTDFYLRQCFVTHSFYKDVPLEGGGLPMKEISFGDIAQMKTVYDGFMRDKNGWFYRDEAAFDLRLREIFGEGGKAYGLFDGGRMEGYILTFDDEEIDEYCGVTPDVIKKYDTHFESVKENVGPGGELDNMLRICDNKLLLGSVKYPADIDMTVTFSVEDSFYAENSGVYSLTVAGGKGMVSDAPKGEIALTVEDLTKLVCGCYDKGAYDERLEKIFPPMLNCALDKF